jgi:hypothetical protein
MKMGRKVQPSSPFLVEMLVMLELANGSRCEGKLSARDALVGPASI